jgi:osmotically-inducible protein OsmY
MTDDEQTSRSSHRELREPVRSASRGLAEERAKVDETLTLMADTLAQDLAELVEERADPAQVKHDIEKAFERNARLHASGLSVEVADEGKVSVHGVVSSRTEHDAAIAAVSASRGVREVEDRISVVP